MTEHRYQGSGVQATGDGTDKACPDTSYALSGMVTVGDVIERQKELPTEYLSYVKARFLGINLD